MTLATRIAVMDQGEIRQIGTPTEIYEFPKTRFVADFIGSINHVRRHASSPSATDKAHASPRPSSAAT